MVAETKLIMLELYAPELTLVLALSVIYSFTLSFLSYSAISLLLYHLVFQFDFARLLTHFLIYKSFVYL